MIKQAHFLSHTQAPSVSLGRHEYWGKYMQQSKKCISAYKMRWGHLGSAQADRIIIGLMAVVGVCKLKRT